MVITYFGKVIIFQKKLTGNIKKKNLNVKILWRFSNLLIEVREVHGCPQ